MYKIQFKNRSEDDDYWMNLFDKPFDTIGKAEIQIIVEELEDEEMGYDFLYRIVEV